MSTGSIQANENRSRVDKLFGVLADPDRRIALQYLLTQESAVGIDDLLDEVVSDSQSPGAEISRAQLHTRFVHVHLPKLADIGVIEYDLDAGIVESIRTIDEIEPYLEWIESDAD